MLQSFKNGIKTKLNCIKWLFNCWYIYDISEEEIGDNLTDNSLTSTDNKVVEDDENYSYESNATEKEDTNEVYNDNEANTDTVNTIEDSPSTQYEDEYGEDNYDDEGDYDDEENYEDEESYDQGSCFH